MDTNTRTPTDTLLAKGEAAFAAEDLDLASQCFESAIKLSPRSSRAWCDMGAVHFQLGDLEKASHAFRDAAEFDPTNCDAIANAAEVELARGSREEAAPFARDLLSLNPADPFAKNLLRRTGVGVSHRPTALIIDWNHSLGSLAGDLRSHLSDSGWFVPRSDEKFVRLATSMDAQETSPLLQWLDAVQPALVIIGSQPENAADAGAWCASHHALLANIDPDSQIAQGPRIARFDPQSESDLNQLVSFIDGNLGEATAKAESIDTARAPEAAPLLSVIAPTYERATCLRNLLDRLALQDIPPHLFEVIIVDDGSKIHVTETFADFPLPYRCKFLTQKNAGPGAARNRAIAEVQGKYLLIFNDDAVPSLCNLRRHLTAQLSCSKPEAVLGTFDFDARARRDVFTDLMQNSGLLFEYRKMKPGQCYDWKFFWTCNLSIPTDEIRAVGGFDEEFRHAICEDVELGLRLEKERGIQVRFDPRIRAVHDHDLNLPRFLERHALLGTYHLKLTQKHPEHGMSAYGCSAIETNSFHIALAFRRKLESSRRNAAVKLQVFQELSAEAELLPVGSAERMELLGRMAPVLKHYAMPFFVESLLERELQMPKRDLELQTEMTSIIMPNLNGFPHVKGALSSLRKNTDGHYETIVIDNGSKDGSLEWLREQSDVTLIELGENLGAPAARNAGLQVAQGETICFCDNDVIFTPGWRGIHLDHLEAWPDIGIVGPMSDYVTGGQKTEQLENPGESLDAFAERFHEEHAGEHLYTARLILFFMVCRREVIDKIGGIDARYRRWGFEDDDFALRCLIAGYQLRIAKDCYIRHIGSQTSKTAKINYNELLLENWEVFKRRWAMDTSLPYGTPWDAFSLADRPFDKARDYVPLTAGLPKVSATV